LKKRWLVVGNQRFKVAKAIPNQAPQKAAPSGFTRDASTQKLVCNICGTSISDDYRNVSRHKATQTHNNAVAQAASALQAELVTLMSQPLSADATRRITERLSDIVTSHISLSQNDRNARAECHAHLVTSPAFMYVTIF
jgi:hypothetical protein